MSFQVIEVVNGYCIIVAVVPVGSPLAERRVNISSIRPPKLVDSSGESKTIEHFARSAKEFLRTRLIGKQVLSELLQCTCCSDKEYRKLN
jgi:staphylococcal nuclease domain-containing protein 1